MAGNFTPTGVPSGSGVTVNFSAPTATDTISLNAAITLGTLNFTNNSTFVETLANGTGSLTLQNTGTSEAAINFSGTTVTTNALTISASTTLNSNLRFTVNPVATGSATATITGTLTGSGGFIKDGPGQFSFSTAAKTYTGATTVAQGRLRYTSSGQSTGTSSVTVNNTGSLYLDSSGGAFSFGASGGALITINGAGDSNTLGSLVDANGSTTTLANAVALGSDSTISVTTGTATFQLNGSVSGTSTLTKVGPGTLNFNGANASYTGGTSVTNGTITVSSGSKLGSGALSFAQTTGVNTAVTLNNATQTIGSLSSTFTDTTGTQSQTLTLNGTALTINQTSGGTFGNGAVSTLTSAITGTGSIIKTGTATLTLSGANTYTGNTNINQGTLLVSGSLNGNGITVNVNNTGALTLTNATALNDFSTLNLFSGSTLSLNAMGGSETIGLLNLDGTAIGPGTYSIATLSMDDPNITFNSPNSETLTVTGVPEPATVLGGILLVGALGWDQRRRLRGLAGLLRNARAA